MGTLSKSRDSRKFAKNSRKFAVVDLHGSPKKRQPILGSAFKLARHPEANDDR
jgi:hypothetical protein